MKRVEPISLWRDVYWQKSQEGKHVPCACCWFVQKLSKKSGMCLTCRKINCDTTSGTPCNLDVDSGLMFEFLTKKARRGK